MIYVLVIPTDFDRKDAERLENQTFETLADLTSELQKLTSWDGEEKMTSFNDVIFELTDFMDAYNDEEVDADGTWITYVNVNKRK